MFRRFYRAELNRVGHALTVSSFRARFYGVAFVLESHDMHAHCGSVSCSMSMRITTAALLCCRPRRNTTATTRLSTTCAQWSACVPGLWTTGGGNTTRCSSTCCGQSRPSSWATCTGVATRYGSNQRSTVQCRNAVQKRSAETQCRNAVQ